MFAKLPENNHFKKTEYIKIVPKTLFEDKISFELGSLSSPFVYQLSDAMMEVKLKISKSDGRALHHPRDKASTTWFYEEPVTFYNLRNAVIQSS